MSNLKLSQMKTAFLNYEIEQSQSVIGSQTWFVARCNRISPKSKMGFKPVFAYRFPTESKMIDYVEGFKKRVIETEREKSQKKAVKRSFENPFKVGDILTGLWGWEQTNIDFYQVVKTSDKTIVMRPVEQVLTEYTGNGMAGYTMPQPNKFKGEEITKVLQSYVTKDPNTGEYKANVYIPSKHGTISKWDGKKEYCSWYA